jgi:hypothetical protein
MILPDVQNHMLYALAIELLVIKFRTLGKVKIKGNHRICLKIHVSYTTKLIETHNIISGITIYNDSLDRDIGNRINIEIKVDATYFLDTIRIASFIKLYM